MRPARQVERPGHLVILPVVVDGPDAVRLCVQAAGAVVRLGGQVKPGSVDWNAEENMLRFDLSDGKQAVPVECTGAPPQMFREGIGVVVEGTVTATGVFSSDRLMVKHSNEYKAPDEEMSDAERKAMYDSVLEGDG